MAGQCPAFLIFGPPCGGGLSCTDHAARLAARFRAALPGCGGTASTRSVSAGCFLLLKIVFNYGEQTFFWFSVFSVYFIFLTT